MPRAKHQPPVALVPEPTSVLAHGFTTSQLNRMFWEQGNLNWLLRRHQMPLYEAIRSTPPLARRPILIARQWGKSYTITVVAEENARQSPGSIQRIIFPTITQSKSVLLPNWLRVLRTCPEDLRPRESMADGCWIWPKHVGPDGPSRLYVGGTDDADQREQHRGGHSDWIFLDEAGSHKELRYLVEDILDAHLDEKRGRMVMPTTPPKSMSHDFVKFYEQGKKIDPDIGQALLVVKTIHDNTHLSDDSKRKICRKANPDASEEEVTEILSGKRRGTAAWRRERLCEMVTDEGKRVVDKFDELLNVADFGALPFGCQPYVFMDLGFHPDPFAAIFAVHDPTTDLLLVADEWVKRKQSSRDIVAAMRTREAMWFPEREIRRFADDPRGEQQLKDFRADHDYSVTQGRKSDGKRGAADRLNVHFQARKIVIHPRCVNLIAQLRDGVWSDGQRIDYDRSEKLGHLDALDALGMGLRCVAFGRKAEESEPLPNERSIRPVPPKPAVSVTAKRLKSMFRGAYG